MTKEKVLERFKFFSAGGVMMVEKIYHIYDEQGRSCCEREVGTEINSDEIYGLMKRYWDNDSERRGKIMEEIQNVSR